jgi:hypothetical protein
VTGRARRLAVLVALAALVSPEAARASPRQESTFQDDALLVYGTAAQQAARLATLSALGADRVRVTLQWRLVAPAAGEARKPDGFDGADPAAYPAGAWDRYDRLVRLAEERNLGVNLDVTAPAPNWATGTPPGRPDIDATFDPSAAEFGAFVRAAALRYPGVHYWSIWNEPNDTAWLTPQWLRDPRDRTRWVPTAPQVYRRLVDAAWTALQETGHGHDTILVGETAPKGALEAQGVTRSIDAQRFIRELYCVDDHLQFYKGTSAEVRACPTTNQVAGFVAAHPALFATTFQSGLKTRTGERKPAYDAYALPLWLPSRTVRKGRALDVWGLVRAAPEGRHVPVSI